MSNAIDILIGDHNRVRGLFAQFTEAHEKKNSGVMQVTAAKIISELEAHTTIEEEIFYPAVKPESSEIGDTVAEGLQEHHVAKVLMSELKALNPSDEEWPAKVKVLIESVEHHASEEESELFPSVRAKTSSEELDHLGIQLEARKRELGAPSPADAEGATKDQLIDLAKEQEIPGRSTMSKEELALSVDARSLPIR